MTQGKFKHAAIIGMGLIGSSLARAFRQYGCVERITGADSNDSHRQKAAELKLADEVFANPSDAVKGADLVILATPVSTYADIVGQIQNDLEHDSVLTDTGSVKARVLADLQYIVPGDVHLIPSHPVAGTEHSGPEAGFAELFANRHVILTPPEGSDAQFVDKLKGLWQACGADVEIMTAIHHDRVLAITSHLPHLLAYSIVQTADMLEKQMMEENGNDADNIVQSPEVIRYSAGGFRDFTRIAASDPVMWRDVFLSNREAVLEMLGRFQEDLFSLQKAVRDGNGEMLFDWFTRTRKVRRKIIDEKQAGTYIPTESDEG